MSESSGSHSDLPSPYVECDDEIDLLELVSTLWEAKWMILGGGFAAAILVAAYSLRIPNEYQASALLSPSQANTSGASSQLSGLAGLAGISLSGSSVVDPTQVALETLQSRKFLIDFVMRREIKPELVAAIGYNLEQNRWQYDVSRYNEKAREWLENKAPDSWEIYRALRDKLGVNFDSRKGIVTVSLASYSSAAASEWLTLLIEDLNRHLMEKEVSEAERSIAYLQQKLQETALTEMRQVFYQLIEQQTRTIMLARAKPEHALATIDPPLEPSDKSGPRRAIMVLVAGMLGVMLMAMAVFIRQGLENNRAQALEPRLSPDA
jgi:LPS O-antigen subunit length determinant protein (WzzB/FepE family)